VLELFQEVYDSIEMVVYLFARRFAQVDNMGKAFTSGALRAGALIARRMTSAKIRGPVDARMTQKQQLSG
jgi:hypothetical protein